MGQGGPKNDGVASLVESTPGALGYVELTYALDKKNLRQALLKTATGDEYVEASLESVTAAAARANIPDNMIFSLVNIEGPGIYPACGVVWAVAKTTSPKADGLKQFLTWALGNEGQSLTAPEHYAPLPPAVAEKALLLVERLSAR